MMNTTLNDSYCCKNRPNKVAALGLPREAFHPILPSPRYLPQDEIDAEEDGNPIIERRLFLLDTRIPEDEIKSRFPTLWRYLEAGKARAVQDGTSLLGTAPVSLKLLTGK